MAFCRAMIFWSSLAMFGIEYGTAYGSGLLCFPFE
jgi:hypothetical protein